MIRTAKNAKLKIKNMNTLITNNFSYFLNTAHFYMFRPSSWSLRSNTQRSYTAR